MRLIVSHLLVLSVVSASLGGAAVADEKSFRLIMPDGQLRSHPVRVYVPETNITSAMKPKLRLVRISRYSDGLEDDPESHGREYSPFEVAPNQTWQDEIEPNLVRTGTILLFNLRNFPISWYKTGTRVQPVLCWNDPESECKAIGGQVYLSNGIVSFCLTLIIVGALLGFAWFLRRDEEGLLGLVATKGGLSMSLTQMALWTIAVGSVVLGFGLMRLAVPDIPDNLVLLMGGAAATAGVGHWQTYRWRQTKKEKEDKETKKRKKKVMPQGFLAKLQTLLMAEVEGEPKPSLAKAQVLFWTLITLIVFVAKSVLDGELWDVPTELVALMGVSQLSFLARNELAVRDDQRRASAAARAAGAS